MSNIFPLIPGLQEQIDNITNTTSTKVQKLGRCFLFDFEKGEYVVKDGKLVEITDDVEKIKQWIRSILQTYKDKFKVYKDTNFYCNIEDLRGEKLDDFIMSELSREITESLLNHRYIKNVTNFSFEQIRLTVTISFSVTLITGDVFTMNEVL